MGDTLFDIIFLEDASDFLRSLDKKTLREDPLQYPKSSSRIRSGFDEKLNQEIWEFRTLYQGIQYRLLAFWDKSEGNNSLVIATHGFIKKRSKVPENEIEKALNRKEKYFQEKKNG